VSAESGVKILLLGHAGDATVARAAHALRARHGNGRVLAATPEELALAPRWSHRLDGARVSTRIELRGGAAIDGEELCVVLNRMRGVWPPQFAGASVEDQQYAAMETFALWLSWLASLRCPVVNPVTSRGFSEPGWHPLTWQLWASRAGLPARELLLTTSTRRSKAAARPVGLGPEARAEHIGLAPIERPAADPFRNCGDRPEWFAEAAGGETARALVVGERVLTSRSDQEGAPSGRASADLPEAILESCVRLARLARMSILELAFVPSRGAARRWMFAGANPFPEITGGEGLEALADHLEGSTHKHNSSAARASCVDSLS
jgi:hypothetical protein